MPTIEEICNGIADATIRPECLAQSQKCQVPQLAPNLQLYCVEELAGCTVPVSIGGVSTYALRDCGGNFVPISGQISCFKFAVLFSGICTTPPPSRYGQVPPAAGQPPPQASPQTQPVAGGQATVAPQTVFAPDGMSKFAIAFEWAGFIPPPLGTGSRKMMLHIPYNGQTKYIPIKIDYKVENNSTGGKKLSYTIFKDIGGTFVPASLVGVVEYQQYEMANLAFALTFAVPGQFSTIMLNSVEIIKF